MDGIRRGKFSAQAEERTLPATEEIAIRRISAGQPSVEKREPVIVEDILSILIEDFDDPRVLLAISKATLLSPPIMQTPYYGKSLELQLRQQIQAYLSSDIVFDYDHEKDILVIPEVFQLQSELFQKYYTNNKRFRVYEPTMHSAFNFIYELGDDKDRAILEKISSDTEIKFKRRRWRYYMKLNESEK